jgi:hypothetical protein
MEYPEEVHRAVEKAEAAHPENVEAAIDAAVKAVRALPTFADFERRLVRGAVATMVYNCRHAANVLRKREAGDYGGPAKVSATSEAVGRVAELWYQHRILGKTFGTMLGKELLPTAEAEANRAEGALFNVELCRGAHNLGVGDEQSVKDAISERKLNALVKRALKSSTREQPASAAGD